MLIRHYCALSGSLFHSQIGAEACEHIRVTLQAPTAAGHAEVFLFINDENDQNEECLLLRMRFR